MSFQQLFRRYGPIVFLFMLFGMLATQATPALATTMSASPAAGELCASTILDETSSHVLRNDGSIVAMVDKLERDGVDVRVRAVDTAPGGSLDAYYTIQLQGCPDWSTNGTQVKPNLVIIMITMEHHDLVTSGNSSTLANVSNDIDGIRGEIKEPYDRGNYVQAITAALQRVYGDLHPGFNWDIVWIILFIIAAVAAVIGLLALLGSASGGGTSSGSGGGGSYRTTTIIAPTAYMPPPSTPPSSGGYSSGSC